MDLAALVQLGIKTSIVVSMIGIGLTATAREEVSLFREPGRLLRSLAAMMIIVPLFAIIVVQTFELEPAVKIAIAALSVSPVPPLWPKKIRWAGGEESYTMGLLVATAVLSIVIIPLAMMAFQAIFAVHLYVSPSSIAIIALSSVVLPTTLGIVIRRLAPRVATRIARPLSIVGMTLLVVSVLPILFKLWTPMTTLIGDGTLLTMIAFVLVGLIAGHVLGGPSQEERSVLALVAASRHPAIALAIAHQTFPDEKLVLPALLLYLIVSGIATIPYITWSKGQVKREHRAIVALR